MGYKALVVQCRERRASVILRSYPEGDHPRLMPNTKIMVLEPLRCSLSVAG